MSVETLSPDPKADIDELRRLKDLVIILHNCEPCVYLTTILRYANGSG